jgi:hypothetical protein
VAALDGKIISPIAPATHPFATVVPREWRSDSREKPGKSTGGGLSGPGHVPGHVPTHPIRAL